MTISGRLDGPDLVLTRHLSIDAETVWRWLTDSERLAEWYGTWTGTPADGFVMVTMNAEGDDQPPSRYAIDACEPARLLRISTDHVRLSVQLDPAPQGSTLALRHHGIDRDAVGDWGTGWEWYLDRLEAAIAGTTPPSLADFDRYVTDHTEPYRTLT